MEPQDPPPSDDDDDDSSTSSDEDEKKEKGKKAKLKWDDDLTSSFYEIVAVDKGQLNHISGKKKKAFWKDIAMKLTTAKCVNVTGKQATSKFRVS